MLLHVESVTQLAQALLDSSKRHFNTTKGHIMDLTQINKELILAPTLWKVALWSFELE
jgi:hypothetical protein